MQSFPTVDCSKAQPKLLRQLFPTYKSFKDQPSRGFLPGIV
jgi:hypothetical protein